MASSKAGKHSSGKYSVTIALDGAIKVKKGDWISKYSIAIHGHHRAIDEYARVRDGRLVALEDPSKIYAGETIYHRPTWLAYNGSTSNQVVGSAFQMRCIGSGQIGKVVNLEKLRKILKAKKYQKYLKGKPGLVADILFFEIRDRQNQLSAYYVYTGGGLGASWPVISASHVGPWNHFRTSRPVNIEQFEGAARYTTAGAAAWTFNVFHILDTPDGVDAVYLEGFETGFSSGAALSTSAGYLWLVGETTKQSVSPAPQVIPTQKPRLVFNGKSLRWMSPTHLNSLHFKAISGLPATHPKIAALIKEGRKDIKKGVDYTQPTYQDVSDVGPIPQGTYYLNLTGEMKYEKTRADGEGWGVGGWRLRNATTLGRALSGLDAKLKKRGIDMPGARSGFFLHHDGGTKGTSGCIGLSKELDMKSLRAEFQKLYKQGHRRVDILVRYS